MANKTATTSNESSSVANAQEKRRQTLEQKKRQELVDLHAIEAAGRPKRNALVKALANPAWIGAAPVGSQKRARSPIRAQEVQSAKKTKSLYKERTTNDKSQSTYHGPSQSKRRHVKIIYSDEDDSGEDEIPPEDELEEEEDTNQADLQSLDAGMLKKTLAQERIQWGQDHSDLHENLDSYTSEDHSGTHGRSSDWFDDCDEDESSNQKQHQLGKRGLERRAERPTWNSHESSGDPLDDIISDGDDDAKDTVDDDDDQDPNAGWAQASFVAPAKGARLISLRVQPSPLKQIIRAAIHTVIGDAIFENAYPSASDELMYYRKTLRSCAHRLNHMAYAKRFKMDHQFGVVVARVVRSQSFIVTTLSTIIFLKLNGRLSTYRGSVKKVAIGKVEGFYQLIEGQACKEQVDDLCRQTSYIYPTKAGEIIKNKPFNHPAIISTLRDIYFAGTRGSYADTYQTRFTSSINEGPRKDERELPSAMVALVATSLHSSLDDYSTGICQKTEFNADLYEDVYIGHITFLNNIKNGSLDKYHRLMANLYILASSVATRRSSAVTNNAMTLLNLADMEV